MKVVLLMVTYNRAKLLINILEKIQNYNWTYHRFIIINNASTDSTQEVLLSFKYGLGLEIITLNENVGHGAGLAQCLKRIQETDDQPEYVVFLEDDSIPQVGYLNFLIHAMEKYSYTMITSGGYLVRLGKRINLSPKKGEILEVDFGLFDGAIAKFMDLMQVGYPVENWFMMFDDFEYCYRIRKAGFRIGVMQNPHLEILHEGWGGGESHSHLWRSYYQSRNFVLFVKKYPSLYNILDALILQSKRIIAGILSKNGSKMRQMRLLGIKAGLLGKTGKSLDLITLKEID